MPRPADPKLRDRILDAAARVYAADPAASLDEVAGAAGVSRATLYRRFSSLEAILSALDAERGLELPRDGVAPARARILDAAGRLLPELGLHGTTVERVAEAAGVGAATVYRHFGDKEGLLRAWLDEASPHRAVAELGRPGGKDLEGDLRRLAVAAITFMRRHPGVIRLALSADAETHALLGRLRSNTATTRSLLAEILRGAMERGVIRQEDPQQLAESFFGLVLARGYVGPFFASAAGDPEVEAAQLVRLFLHGVCVER